MQKSVTLTSLIVSEILSTDCE